MRVHRRTAVCLALDLLLILVLVRTGPGAAVAHDALLDPGRWFVQVSPDAAVVTVLGVLCWFALLWIAVGLLLVSVATTPGAAGRLADALATQVVPTALRRAATLALGLSVGTARSLPGRPHPVWIGRSRQLPQARRRSPAVTRPHLLRRVHRAAAGLRPPAEQRRHPIRRGSRAAGPDREPRLASHARPSRRHRRSRPDRDVQSPRRIRPPAPRRSGCLGTGRPRPIR